MAQWSATITFAAGLWLLCALSVSSVSCRSLPTSPAEAGGEVTLDMRNDMDRAVRVTVPQVLRFWDTQTSTERLATATPYTKEVKLLVDDTLQPSEAKTITLRIAPGSHVGPARAYADGQLVFCEQFTGDYVRSNSRQGWDLVVRQGPLQCEPRGPWR